MATSFSDIPDIHQQGNCIYSQHDVVMNALARMFFQDPSLLHFQTRLEQQHQRNNLRNILRLTTLAVINNYVMCLIKYPVKRYHLYLKNFMKTKTTQAFRRLRYFAQRVDVQY
jgi:hypothetical protein